MSEHRNMFRLYKIISGTFIYKNMFIKLLTKIQFSNKTEISFFYRNENLKYFDVLFQTFLQAKLLNFIHEVKWFVYNFLHIRLQIKVPYRSFVKPKHVVLLENSMTFKK